MIKIILVIPICFSFGFAIGSNFAEGKYGAAVLAGIGLIAFMAYQNV
jgi:hypothetical protein